MKISLLAAAIFFAAVSSFAQGQVIEKSEFEAIYNKSVYPSVRWKGRKYRATTITGTASSNHPDKNWSSQSIQEFDGESTRARSESRLGKDEPRVSETIRIGETVYARTGDGPWTTRPSTTTASSGAGVGDVSTASSESEYRFLGMEEFRGTPTKTYLRLTTGTRVNAQGAETRTVSRIKYWFDAEGTLLRSEFRADSKWDDVTSWTEAILDYELDPSIEITAPNVP
ncbi:MAG TPA: hypothetical protein VK918_01785 [Pyrinomonadaceae bacterium]|nr:hypothetical protein [Pyrinomonadaceae bacterium]